MNQALTSCMSAQLPIGLCPNAPLPKPVRILMDDRLALAPSHTITFVSKPYRCNMNIVSYKVERMNLAFILSELV